MITPALQKIQFASSGQITLNRPDKLRIRRTGGYADVELVFDGKTLSLYGNNAKSYVQADAAGTVDQVIDTLQAQTGAGMPGTDLLLSHSYDELMANVVDGEHIGQGVVDGVECEHLAFRGSTRTGRSGSRPGATPDAAQIRDHQQDGGWRAAIYAEDQGLEDGCGRGCGHLRVQAAGRCDQGRLDSSVMIEFDELPPGTPAGARNDLVTAQNDLVRRDRCRLCRRAALERQRDHQRWLRLGAEARVGRPLTPMSYAGVARRTTRRAVVGGAVVGGAVAAGAYGAYAAPACAQVVDAYGRIYTQC